MTQPKKIVADSDNLSRLINHGTQIKKFSPPSWQWFIILVQIHLPHIFWLLTQSKYSDMHKCQLPPGPCLFEFWAIKKKSETEPKFLKRPKCAKAKWEFESQINHGDTTQKDSSRQWQSE